jgi:hypothetical protein
MTFVPGKYIARDEHRWRCTAVMQDQPVHGMPLLHDTGTKTQHVLPLIFILCVIDLRISQQISASQFFGTIHHFCDLNEIPCTAWNYARHRPHL